MWHNSPINNGLKLWQKLSLIETLDMELIKDLLDQNNLDFVTKKNV